MGKNQNTGKHKAKLSSLEGSIEKLTLEECLTQNNTQHQGEKVQG